MEGGECGEGWWGTCRLQALTGWEEEDDEDTSSSDEADADVRSIKKRKMMMKIPLLQMKQMLMYGPPRNEMSLLVLIIKGAQDSRSLSKVEQDAICLLLLQEDRILEF